MRSAALLSFALAALSIHHVFSSPMKRQAIDDITILNYALTLEHLEKAFYSGALAKFDQKAFDDAGLPSFARGRFQQIAGHERAHVDFLSSALGDKATKPCTYNFPYTDVKSFIALSQVFEGVGVSAYTGAAQYISNKDYLTAAAVVLSTEARHASWVAAAVNKYSGWGGAFDTPLGLNEIYTIVATAITACPSSNPPLPVRAFSPLSLSKLSAEAKFEVTHRASADPTHIAFYFGLGKTFVPIVNGKVAVPPGLEGQAYAVATNSATVADDSTILAGPAILDFESNSNGHSIN
ncbi:hypothetical protein GALMADRAFT_130255 [Galerina marginata CBS 339.88]|uniref:Ferritin-like domain-containing protein n=1 Tax=Galerina marginata (strain CBS 339.88) TaxID=685588 RepID=A0A067SIH4_GALM3|nr:hypothetical protein GALMADRAFT_130255 [Galerina marginata CBS 339.88]